MATLIRFLLLLALLLPTSARPEWTLRSTCGAAIKFVAAQTHLHPLRSLKYLAWALNPVPARRNRDDLVKILKSKKFRAGVSLPAELTASSPISEDTALLTDNLGRHYRLKLKTKENPKKTKLKIANENGDEQDIDPKFWELTRSASDVGPPDPEAIAVKIDAKVMAVMDNLIGLVTTIEMPFRFSLFPYFPFLDVLDTSYEHEGFNREMFSAWLRRTAGSATLGLAYAASIYYGVNPAMILAVVSENPSISAEEVVERTAKQFTATADQTTVYVDGVPDVDLLSGFQYAQYEKRRLIDPGAQYAKVTSVAQLYRELDERGRVHKLKNVDLNAHGVEIDGLVIIEIGEDILTNDPTALRALWGKAKAAPSGITARYADLLPHGSGRAISDDHIFGLDEFQPLNDRFEPDARIRLISCEVGASQSFMKRFAGSLADKGGVVMGANVSISVSRFEMPPEAQAKLMVQNELEARKRAALPWSDRFKRELVREIYLPVDGAKGAFGILFDFSSKVVSVPFPARNF